MKIDDVKYLCTVIGNLAGIPIRIYNDNEKIFYYSIVDLIRDPVTPYEEKILKIERVSYFITPRFHYYGVVNYNEYKIVLGPSRQWTANKNDLKELAFECDVPQDETENFINAMQSLTVLPLNSIIQTLCPINFVLNGEKLSIADITIYDDEQLRILDELTTKETEKNYNEAENLTENTVIHNTLGAEQAIMNFVRRGDAEALQEWLKNAPAVRPGILSSDAIRQLKNTFIVTATLVSRSAIRGGMDVNDALSLSDAYVQKCELLSSVDSIENLQFYMVLDYTKRVEKIRIGAAPTKLLTDIANYVQKHITEPIDIDALSKAMFISRTHLATKFKKETGMTLTDYILKEKVEESKRLLLYTDKTISSIAVHLGFSSQSHFSNVFRKYTSASPNEYRKTHDK